MIQKVLSRFWQLGKEKKRNSTKSLDNTYDLRIRFILKDKKYILSLGLRLTVSRLSQPDIILRRTPSTLHPTPGEIGWGRVTNKLHLFPTTAKIGPHASY